MLRGAARTSASSPRTVPSSSALLPFPPPGPFVQDSQLGVDLGDPFPPVRGAGGRADVPGPPGDVTPPQWPVTPAPVGEHRGRRAGVFVADGGQDGRDRVRGQPGRRIRAQRGGQRTAGTRRAGADQQLAVGGQHGAVRLHDRAEQARGQQRSFQSGPLFVTYLVSEVDAPPQRLPGASGVQPGRVSRLGVPLRGQVRALGAQRRLPLPVIASLPVEARPGRLHRGPGRARRRVGHLVEAVQRHVTVTRQRFGVQDQRADERMGRPVDLAEQRPGAGVTAPGAPGLRQGDRGGVPFGREVLRRAGVIVRGGAQLPGLGFRAEHLLFGLRQPPRFRQPALRQAQSFGGACLRRP